jgi:hypothetical protein
MEKQLDDMSVQCDEKDRLMNEKKELLKGFEASAGETAMEEKERDAMSQLMGGGGSVGERVKEHKGRRGRKDGCHSSSDDWLIYSTQRGERITKDSRRDEDVPDASEASSGPPTWRCKISGCS